MTQAKHTPGPWVTIADPCHFDSLSTVIGGDNSMKKGVDGELVVQVGGWANWQTQEANARLIAAAPELLEALQEMWDAHGSNTSGSLSKLVLDALNKATGATND